MARAFILVLDSLGIGYAPDAEQFGDTGANTLLHIAQRCASGQANTPQRQGALHIPNLCRLGISHALELACGEGLPGVRAEPAGGFAAAQEVSAGKDTPSGHWEIMGVPVRQEWGLFPADENGGCFPPALLQRILEKAGLEGSLGNCHASGTAILERFGQEHMRSGRPIFYTSADSVFQVACHEQTFTLERLYALCAIIRDEVDSLRIGRVIARPFAGDSVTGFQRTGDRRDYTTPPPEPTLFDRMSAGGGTTISIGKIADIFAHQGITTAIKATGTQALFEETLRQAGKAPDNSIVMTNFVDFDQTFGHRRNVAGYANELEHFDRLLARLLPLLQKDDMLAITADHGCDPTWPGTDHTREYAPQLIFGPRIKAACHGLRKSFADLGQTVAHWLGLPAMAYGAAYHAYAGDDITKGG